MGNAVKNYLRAYNFIAFAFWAFFLLSFIASGLNIDGLPLVLLNIAQGLAVLEIIHAILKWVKSPVLSTSAQIVSRLLVLAFIDVSCYHYFSQGMETSAVFNGFNAICPGIIIISFAWSVTEIIRYSFYFLSLFSKQPYWLLWMRYSFFIVLYPLGVTGEWFIFLARHNSLFKSLPYSALIIVLFISYAYYFPVLYKYMWKQRKLKL